MCLLFFFLQFIEGHLSFNSAIWLLIIERWLWRTESVEVENEEMLVLSVDWIDVVLLMALE